MQQPDRINHGQTRTPNPYASLVKAKTLNSHQFKHINKIHALVFITLIVFTLIQSILM